MGIELLSLQAQHNSQIEGADGRRRLVMGKHLGEDGRPGNSTGAAKNLQCVISSLGPRDAHLLHKCYTQIENSLASEPGGASVDVARKGSARKKAAASGERGALDPCLLDCPLEAAEQVSAAPCGVDLCARVAVDAGKE